MVRPGQACRAAGRTSHQCACGRVPALHVPSSLWPASAALPLVGVGKGFPRSAALSALKLSNTRLDASSQRSQRHELGGPSRSRIQRAHVGYFDVRLPAPVKSGSVVSCGATCRFCVADRAMDVLVQSPRRQRYRREPAPRMECNVERRGHVGRGPQRASVSPG